MRSRNTFEPSSCMYERNCIMYTQTILLKLIVGNFSKLFISYLNISQSNSEISTIKYTINLNLKLIHNLSYKNIQALRTFILYF